MIRILNRDFTSTLLSLIVTMVFVFMIGCEIEADDSDRGRIFVELRDTLRGDPIEGARIWLDGVQTSQTTPDTLRSVSPGQHEVAATKPGYLEVSMQVDVAAGQVTHVTMTTQEAPPAAIELVDAPDGTVLLINSSPFGVTPPTVFGDVGSGTWNVSAYLEGFATASPARWTVTLEEGDTARINAQFQSLTAGPAVGQLAPVFALPSDGDSTIYRLQDYRGTITLVTFFFYNCAPCLVEFPYIQAVYSDPEYAGSLQVLGVDASDPWYFLNRYRNDHPELALTFPLLWDQTQVTRTDLYQFSTHPANYLIDPSGTVRYVWESLTEEQLRSSVEALIDEFDFSAAN